MPSIQAVQALVYAAVIGFGLAFVLLDHRAPSWDQSHYLELTYRYDTALVSSGVRGAIHQILTLDPGRAPLFSVAMMPFNAGLGSSFRSGELLNLLLWPILLYSVHGIASTFFGEKAATLAMVFVATMPLLVGLSHEVLQDFMVATLTTLTVHVMLRTRSFNRPGASLALGALLCLDALAKITAIAYVIGPLLVYVLWAAPSLIGDIRSRQLRREGIRRLGNLAFAGIVGLGGSLLWYLPNLRATLNYLALATGGTGVVGNAPSDYGSLRSLLAFTVLTFDAATSWLIVVAGLVALAAVIQAKVGDAIGGHVPNLRSTLFKVCFLGTWALVPWLVVGLSNNQDQRYVASSLPAIAIVSAGLIVSIRFSPLRRLVVGATSTLLVLQQTFIVLGFSAVPLLPERVSWSTGFGPAVVDFSSQGIGYDRRPDGPSSDYPFPIINYLESRSRVGGVLTPRRIALLETEPYVNGNTLGYISDVRGDPFTFGDVMAQPPNELIRTLGTYDFILFVPPPRDADRHIIAVNSAFAQSEVSPAILAAYSHEATFPSAPDQEVMILDHIP